MDKLTASVSLRSKELLRLYVEQKPYMSFKRGLAECRDHELRKTGDVKEIYRKNLREVKFLRADYFSDYSRFARNQEIPERYLVHGCSDFFFISHRWEDPREPDPEGRQFSLFKTLFEKLPTGSLSKARTPKTH